MNIIVFVYKVCYIILEMLKRRYIRVLLRKAQRRSSKVERYNGESRRRTAKCPDLSPRRYHDSERYRELSSAPRRYSRHGWCIKLGFSLTEGCGVFDKMSWIISKQIFWNIFSWISFCINFDNFIKPLTYKGALRPFLNIDSLY